jgi:hypothetical protein
VDAAWPVGRGAFGHDTNFASLLSSQISTQLSLSNASNVKISTYYFRAHFTLANDPFGITVTITNLIDDGAVFFINSNEVARVNMPAAPATIAYLTTASSSVEATYKTFDVPPSVLIRGDNLLAVEVHNASVSSLDIGFGLTATVAFPTPIPILITNQPASQITPEDRTITFSVGASGLPLAYQWFKDGLPLPNAQGPGLILTNVLVSNGGQYWVTISNSISFVESVHASLTVLADTNGPVLLSAERTNGNQIRVLFSEAVAPATATNVGNYTLTNLAGGLVPLYAATLLDSTNILLTSEYLSLGSNYVLIVNNVQSRATRIASSRIPPYPSSA